VPSFQHCPGDQLCDSCRHDFRGFFKGVAACRGSVWASSVAKRIEVRAPWPPYAGKCRHIAIGKVSDLTTDVLLRDELARVVWTYAVRSWPSS
jgi:hypothetical protein